MGSLKRALFPPLEFRIPLPRRPSSIAMYVRRGYKNPDSSLVWLPCSMATAPARPTFSVLTRGGSLSGSPLLGPPSPVPLRRGRNCQTLLPPPNRAKPTFFRPRFGALPGSDPPGFWLRLVPRSPAHLSPSLPRRGFVPGRRNPTLALGGPGAPSSSSVSSLATEGTRRRRGQSSG